MDVRKDESGQAIFEMLVFLPLFIFLFTIIFNVGSAINVSINQQKSTRRYFFYLAKGNSYMPQQNNLTRYLQDSTYSRVGMSFIGLRQKEISDNSTGSCFKFSSFITSGSGEECDEGPDLSGTPVSTNYIRVFTGFGICGDTYKLLSSPHKHWVSAYTTAPGEIDPRSTGASCEVAL